MSRIRRTYEEGRTAFYRGMPLSSPYLRHLPEDEAWRAGWEDASGIPQNISASPQALDHWRQADLWDSASQ